LEVRVIDRKTTALEDKWERNRLNGYENRNGIRASDDIFNHSEQRSDQRRVRIYVPAEYSGTKKAITRTDWSQSLSLSRQLYARIGELSGAIRQKATYVVGDSWRPHFAGVDSAWGEAAEQYLEYWFDCAIARGGSFDFVTALWVDCISIDRDGDAAMLTVMEGDQPRVQFIPAHQIGFRNNVGQDIVGYGKVPEGIKGGDPYVGLRCYNGVIFANSGREIAYGIIGETAAEDRIVGIDACQLLYEPDWQDQGRGITATGYSILHWMDHEDIAHYLKRQVKQDSMQGIMHYNDSGTAEDSETWITKRTDGSANTDVKVETLEGNEFIYMKAEGGGKLAPYTSNRPDPNIQEHNKGLLRAAFQAIQWPYELYDPKEVGGASTRLIQDAARAVVNRRQRCTYKRWFRAITHALAVAMENGDLPRNEKQIGPIADWMKWQPTLPAKVTVDARYDDKTKMEKLRMCAGTYAEIYGDDAKDWKAFIRQRFVEQKYINELGVEFGVDPKEIQLLTPNGNPQPADSEGDGEGQDMLDTENLKAQFDAFGVGVRSGAITPTPQDEDYFRGLAGLPPTSPEALADWEKTKKVRKPITLAGPEGARLPGGQFSDSEKDPSENNTK
jgi:hypothetical protein